MLLKLLLTNLPLKAVFFPDVFIEPKVGICVHDCFAFVCYFRLLDEWKNKCNVQYVVMVSISVLPISILKHLQGMPVFPSHHSFSLGNASFKNSGKFLLG